MPWFAPSTETVVRRISRAWRLGDTDAQERIAASYARKRPDVPRAWVIWGNVRFRQDDYAGAEEVLKRGLARHPTADPDLGWLLARAVLAQGRSVEAKEILDTQVIAFPKSRLPYLGLLEVAVISGEWQEADRLAAETQTRTPSDDFAGKYELAFALVQIPGRREEAISVLREVVDAVPRYPDPLLFLGTVLEKAGDPEAGKSIDLARKMWKARPRLHSTRSSPGDGLSSRSPSRSEATGKRQMLEWTVRRAGAERSLGNLAS